MGMRLVISLEYLFLIKRLELRRFTGVCLIFGSLITLGQPGHPSVHAQYNIHRNPVRLFLNRISFTLTPGVSSTYYKHDLKGLYLIQDQDNQYVLPTTTDISGQSSLSGYADWLNDPVLGPVVVGPTIPLPVSNPSLLMNPALINGDSVDIGFRGAASGIPVTVQVHYNFLENFRAGLGFTWEKQYMRPLEPRSLENIVRPYEPSFASTSYTRWFVTAGYKFFEWNPYSLVAEGQFGLINGNKRQFNRELVTHTVYGNIGLSIEQRLSEYFRIIYKTSLDLKGYRVTLPDSLRTEIRHGQPALFFQIGVSINVPEIPRSPIANDHTQVKHVIRNPKTGELREYRGQPIWKEQNPKVGQNHRKLFRFKWFNRRKMHPY